MFEISYAKTGRCGPLVWKKKQRSSKGEDEESMACLTHKERFIGKYLFMRLCTWGLNMRVESTIA